ncbi:hypothetical protein D9613_009556 [Agrocybe pediades]|uniref:AB hydrolase-1 domain-containing protein n=1 Tax=Agrocybe pediades TaxID=84607 RepID=A0A8H4VTW9_9AGAR|nr:hypothetical protein D9613_009556 [Agrocybe pediades]
MDNTSLDGSPQNPVRQIESAESTTLVDAPQGSSLPQRLVLGVKFATRTISTQFSRLSPWIATSFFDSNAMTIAKRLSYRLLKITGILLTVYLASVILLFIPFFQTHAVFLNALQVPLFADFSIPEKYGLAPNRTLNLKIHTSDNESLGAWFILSDSYYHSLPGTEIPNNNITQHVRKALAQKPVVLYLHGNGPTRAFAPRVQQYQTFSTRLDANVLAIDYRGFGDSTGRPSQGGLVMDATVAFDWLVDHGKKEEDILVVGHSLGTGVSGQLGKKLADEGRNCKGIVFLAPFTSIYEVLGSYRLFGFVPFMKPVNWIPGATKFFKWAIVNPFNTLEAASNITAPKILIAHAEDDRVIPHSQSDILFEEFLKPYLRKGNYSYRATPAFDTTQRWNNAHSRQRPLGAYHYPPSLRTLSKLPETERERTIEYPFSPSKHVNTTVIPNFGRVSQLEVNEGDGSNTTFVLVKTLAGEHDYVGLQEGLVDIIGTVFGITRGPV